MILFTLIFLVLSFWKNVSFAVWAFLPLQLLAYINLFYHTNVLEIEDL